MSESNIATRQRKARQQRFRQAAAAEDGPAIRPGPLHGAVVGLLAAGYLALRSDLRLAVVLPVGAAAGALVGGLRSMRLRRRPEQRAARARWLRAGIDVRRESRVGMVWGAAAGSLILGVPLAASGIPVIGAVLYGAAVGSVAGWLLGPLCAHWYRS